MDYQKQLETLEQMRKKGEIPDALYKLSKEESEKKLEEQKKALRNIFDALRE